MKLYFDKRAKDPIYYVQFGFRNGKKATTKNIHRIGKHSELLLYHDDPLKYAKEVVAKFTDDFNNQKIEMTYTIDFSEKLQPTQDIYSKDDSLNVGYFILQKLYQDLHLSDFFNQITSNRKMTFDCNQINRFLTYARILDPDSKLGTYDHLDSYYERPDFDYQHILRYMDVLVEHYDHYLEHLFKYSNHIVKRDTSVCYYDCTNFYFEIESEDIDYIDPVTGEEIKGFRKYGPSKQHQPAPLVEMGLFMDGNGIPISMMLTSGSDNEQTTAIPLEMKIADMFDGKPFIYCADAGLGSSNIRLYNSMKGRAFVVTQSIKKLSFKLKEAVFNDFDYKLLSDDSSIEISFMKSFDYKNPENHHYYKDLAYKVLDVDNLIDLGLYEEKTYKNGEKKQVKSKAKLKQRVIITFSRKMMEYQRAIRNKQIERARYILKNKNVEEVKKGPHDVTRFIKRISKSETGENIIDRYEIDDGVIEKEEMYDGYYAIATNLDDDAKTIIDISSNRYKIEDCFKVLKTNFETRPICHHTKNRITAHFMICYTALLIYRLLEVKLNNYGTHFTIDQIIETLKNMKVLNIEDAYYRATYKASQVCTALNGVFDLGLDKKYYLPKDLNKKIKKLLK